MAEAGEKGGAGEGADVDKELSKNARKIASTFAPRSSTAKKNPAFKGSVLYTIFEVRALSTSDVIRRARPTVIHECRAAVRLHRAHEEMVSCRLRCRLRVRLAVGIHKRVPERRCKRT